MADSLGQLREAPREKGLAALRVLRAKRQREPTKRERWSRLSLAIALLFSAAMFAFLSARASYEPSEHPIARSSARPALRTTSGAQSPSAAPAAPSDGNSVGETTTQALAQPSSDALRARAASDASALRVVNAVPGNPFGIRAGDVIVDLCDRAGVDSAVEISAALADNSAACVVILRGDHIVRAARPSASVQGPNQ